MSNLRAQVSIPYITAVPSDVISNTWWWATDDSEPNSTSAARIALQLEGFYDAVYTSGVWANYLAMANTRLRVYDMADAEPRVPFYDELMPIGAGVGQATQIPTEVAIVLSFRAAPVSGVNPGRLRGRVYLGGFHNTMFNPSGTPDVVPTVAASLRTTIAGQAALMADDSDPSLVWSVCSQVGGVPVLRPVATGYVDNAADTQRRRGTDATARTTFA